MTNLPNKFFELNDAQIQQLVKLAGFRSNDVFYDLGSGEGKTVIEIAKVPAVRRSIGIERLLESSETARRAAIKGLRPHQLRKVAFWYGEMDAKNHEEWWNYFYELKDASVVYYSLHEDTQTLEWLKERFQNKRLRIITKDLPFVGYRSIANRLNDDCWFFLTNLPLSSGSRVKSKNEWAESVLGTPNITVDHVRSYFGGQLSKRKAYSKKDVIEGLLEMEILINKRF